MRKMNVYMSTELGENTYQTTLKNGLDVYICKKEGFQKKVGLFGTKYGSLTNDFMDIATSKRVQVPAGIAHFLEHKLFEKEGDNALDIFSRIGVSANAYTSLDQTVYYFETIEKFEPALEVLVRLVKEPYFTDENVKKEQGIIDQELLMYQDEPSYMVYFNMLRAMYQKSPINVDVVGTLESIASITKELLYTCYHTFYSPQNMFFIVVGDVDVETTINSIEENIKKYEKGYEKDEKKAIIQKFMEEEPPEIKTPYVEGKMDVYMPQISVGYKMDMVEKSQILKRQIVADFINHMYFSRLSNFYEEEYQKGVLNEPLYFDYEGGEGFSHVVISGASVKIEELKNDLQQYLDKIIHSEIDTDLFDLIKKKKIGYIEFMADNMRTSYTRIIESIINETALYEDIQILKDIKKEDIKDFLQLLESQKEVVSVILPKE